MLRCGAVQRSIRWEAVLKLQGRKVLAGLRVAVLGALVPVVDADVADLVLEAVPEDQARGPLMSWPPDLAECT